MSDVVRLRVGEVVFEVEKNDLLFRFEHTYFHGMLSGPWQPDADGAYYIGRPVMGFDRILDYLRSGKLSVEGLTSLEADCVYSNLDFFLIPHKRQWKYTTQSEIEGLNAHYVCELKDGRLCGAYKSDLIVWNMDTGAVEMILNGHTATISRVIQLEDGRVCSCSNDTTIKLWSIDSGLCELTLTGFHSMIRRVIQLFDGRLCASSSFSESSLRVYNVSTGVCELTINTQNRVFSIAQLADGRICCGGDFADGSISIFSVLTGECELSWKGHTSCVHAIVCVDADRIVSGSSDRTIKVWNTGTGECQRTLEGHTSYIYSMVLMQDGRLCSTSYDGTLRLWNIETGVCENTLNSKNACGQVLQLEDGRLLSTEYDGRGTVVWS